MIGYYIELRFGFGDQKVPSVESRTILPTSGTEVKPGCNGKCLVATRHGVKHRKRDDDIHMEKCRESGAIFFFSPGPESSTLSKIYSA